MLHKVLKSQWVSCPILFYRLVGIGAYARMASEGDTYCSVCIQLISRMRIPKMLRVGNVGVQVGLKWPYSAGLILQDLAHLALWVRVVDKSRLRYGQTSKLSLFVLCHGANSTLPSYMPT